jgi:hypothetical protein
MPADQPEATDALLQKLKETPPEALSRGVRHAERLTPEDEDGIGRWLRSEKRRITNKLFKWFLHFMFVVACAVILVVVVSAIILTYLWISSFVANPGKLETFIKGIWNTALVALATLFINGLISRD